MYTTTRARAISQAWRGVLRHAVLFSYVQLFNLRMLNRYCCALLPDTSTDDDDVRINVLFVLTRLMMPCDLLLFTY